VEPYAPDIVDDATCDLCEEAAIPCDTGETLDLCALHYLEYLTDISIDDFLIDANNELAWQGMNITRVAGVHATGDCAAFACRHSALPRHTVRGEYMLGDCSTELCTKHAVGTYIAVLYYRLQAWAQDLEDEVHERNGIPGR
jgi:hypothetical protein